MSTTMHDVALRAGVSVKTVSNVVNGYPYIRESTRDRVLAAIDELGYQMNVSARNLRSGRTGMIGLAVPELSLTYFAELSDNVIQEAEARGWTVLIEQTNATRAREIEVLSGSRRHLIDGVILSPLALGPGDTDYVKPDFPTVLLGERIFHGPVDHITMSNVAAAEAATGHLVGIGRERIALIGAHPGEEVGTAAFRLEGYLRALRIAGIEPDPALVVEAGLWHRPNGAQAMTRLLQAGTEFDAVFCLNDTLALGALRVLHQHGLRVPEDVAIVGFDDIEDTRYATPTLTTIAPGRAQIARLAVEMLLTRIENRSEQQPPVEIEADFELVVRESTGGPPESAEGTSTLRG